MERILLFVSIILFPVLLSMPSSSRWIVWNVGQGEWVTHVTESTCYHFDMGGERMPREGIKEACGKKMNLAYFSHWDQDHIGFAAIAHSILPKLCMVAPPIGEATRKKKKLFEGWPICKARTDVHVWAPKLPAETKKKSANELCQIFSAGKMLVPGDAPAKEEKVFLQSGQNISEVRWLVLGHHGSRTSTSPELLQTLPKLQMAIASARHGKYGHPHIEIESRLQAFHIAMLKTEDWGNIEIED